jgi:hypothetical protein
MPNENPANKRTDCVFFVQTKKHMGSFVQFSEAFGWLWHAFHHVSIRTLSLPVQRTDRELDKIPRHVIILNPGLPQLGPFLNRCYLFVFFILVLWFLNCQ